MNPTTNRTNLTNGSKKNIYKIKNLRTRELDNKLVQFERLVFNKGEIINGQLTAINVQIKKEKQTTQFNKLLT